MSKSRIGIGGLVLAAACAALIPASAAQASTRAERPADNNGCADGTVCMYTDYGYSNATTEQHWWQYGCDNLTNETGDRYILNNQYFGATVTLYDGSDCGGQVAETIPEGTVWEGDITPINSLSLNNS